MAKPSLFTRLGLSAQAATIYRALLKHGPLPIGTLAKHTGLYRPLIYRQLPRLQAAGLVSETRMGQRTLYAAENPSSLGNLVHNLQTELDEVLPSLQQDFEHAGGRPVIRYFQGREGIGHVYEHLLRTAKKTDIIYRYEALEDYNILRKYYPPLYRKMATGPDWQMQKFVITNEKTHSRRRPRLERYSKAVPKSFGAFEYGITQLIYGDKVAFIDYNAETASLIESEVFANFQRQIFKLLFSKLN